MTIEGNWLNGGNYTVYVRDKGTGHPIDDVVITGNRFGQDYRWGLVSSDAPLQSDGTTSHPDVHG